MSAAIDNRRALARDLPAMLRHEGRWEGVYTHFDHNNRIVDTHNSAVTCLFPIDGNYAYIQHNHFTWEDGRETRAELPGILRDERLWWDTKTFHGSAWQTDEELILLHLHRKDEPDAYFVEIIVLGESGEHRSRTWHWFRDGKLFRRTACEETRVQTADEIR